jgi:DNA-binding CsgD family transcriptional regulator
MNTRLATLRQLSLVLPNSLSQRLTPREIQIAQLVAQGLTNAAIGAELWITQNAVKQALKRMFRKLDISARTELVARLCDIL